MLGIVGGAGARRALAACKTLGFPSKSCPRTGPGAITESTRSVRLPIDGVAPLASRRPRGACVAALVPVQASVLKKLEARIRRFYEDSPILKNRAIAHWGASSRAAAAPMNMRLPDPPRPAPALAPPRSSSELVGLAPGASLYRLATHAATPQPRCDTSGWWLNIGSARWEAN